MAEYIFTVYNIFFNYSYMRILFSFLAWLTVNPINLSGRLLLKYSASVAKCLNIYDKINNDGGSWV